MGLPLSSPSRGKAAGQNAARCDHLLISTFASTFASAAFASAFAFAFALVDRIPIGARLEALLFVLGGDARVLLARRVEVDAELVSCALCVLVALLTPLVTARRAVLSRRSGQ